MTSYHPPDLVIDNATTMTGTRLRISIVDGVIDAIDHYGEHSRGDRWFAMTPPENVIDARGAVVLPAPAEPHAHLDKALLAQRVTNRTEDLPGAIEAIVAAYATMDDADLLRRSVAALHVAVAHGYTAVRTHLDCRVGIGTASVRILAWLKKALAGVVDIQIVALSGELTDPDDGAENRRLLVESLQLGADLVGGCPSLEQDPLTSLAEYFAIARDLGCAVDLHVDETIDARVLILRDIARFVATSGFEYPVTASHCVSLGMQAPDVIEETARMLADAGISIVTLPQTNLYLQARETPTAKPRGLTAVEQLRAQGVRMAAGGDNWRDPFNPMGRIDPMETASLFVTAGHQRVSDAYAGVSTDARAIMGLPPVAVEIGSIADLLVIDGTSLADAVAGASANRTVIKAGRVVARTVMDREVDEALTALLTAGP